MTLLFSVVLGILPLFGIGWAFSQGPLTTVDGLFTTLILLTLSGILFLNAFLEIKKRFQTKTAPAPKAN